MGEASNLAEIELILATTKALSQIAHGKKFTVRINDRRVLMAMALYAGYSQDNIGNVFIILDKIDKIGLEGVRKELNELDGEEKCEKYLSLFDGLTNDSKALISLKDSLSGFIEDGVLDGLSEIMNTVLNVKSNDFSLEFDPTLVRGMGYYTGTIFEVSMEGFSGSVAGGGRYDKMIGKFTGNDTPACGFSIGFERIITILMDAGFKIPDESKKIAFLYEKNIEAAVLTNILKEAAAFRELGNIVLVSKMNKNKKFQKEGLEKQGYTQFKEFYREALK